MTGDRTLHSLLADAGLPATNDDHAITGITADSRTVSRGSLFVAIPGTRVDGHRFIADAVKAGAAAVIGERGAAPELAVPTVQVDDARQALAFLAAAWYGHPARKLTLIGITGTVGKTSVLSIVEAILAAEGRRAGSIGSLGLRLDATTVEESSYTVPEPLMLQRQLAHLATAGCELAVMEVTSHALVQQRIAGLEYAAGVFTSLVPLEHAEFHRDFRSYVEAKARFFEYLKPDAPVVYNADDRAVRRLVHDRSTQPIGCGTSRSALARIREVNVSPAGSSMLLDVRRPLARVDGGCSDPLHLPLALPLIGRSNTTNAALAAVLALTLGVRPPTVQRVLAAMPPARRRMEVLHHEDYIVLDDTVGHPDSVSVVFEAVERLAPRRIHIVWAVRGRRGPRINRYNAEALAIWARRVPLESLIITRSRDTADDRNRVGDDEYAAFLRPLARTGVAFEQSADLQPAVRSALERAERNDVVLLLGAQGMDAGAAVARTWLARHRSDLH